VWLQWLQWLQWLGHGVRVGVGVLVGRVPVGVGVRVGVVVRVLVGVLVGVGVGGCPVVSTWSMQKPHFVMLPSVSSCTRTTLPGTGSDHRPER